jgi:hypothetical protein
MAAVGLNGRIIAPALLVNHFGFGMPVYLFVKGGSREHIRGGRRPLPGKARAQLPSAALQKLMGTCEMGSVHASGRVQ